MPSTRTICYYAMYVIGEVESNWTWTSVYYSDPITIGMMQWYGTRAAALLERMKTERPTDYDMLADSLKNDLNTHASNSSYWNSRYLTETEGQSIQRAFESRESHIVQEQQAISDFEGYIRILEGWGMSQSNPKALIFAMNMYHQSPKAAGRVVASAGGNADLERLYTTCLNDKTFQRYKTRHTTVYNRLKDWDGESDPPDFGQNGNVGTGGTDTGISKEGSALNYIIQVGDNLILYGEAPYNNGVTFYKASGQTWKTAINVNGTTIEGGNTGGGTSSNVQAAVDLYVSWVGKFAYSQGPGRLTPLTSGYGDCSSTIWAAYHDAMGIDVGTYTGAMTGKGTLIAEGTNGQLPIENMAAGDLVLVSHRQSSIKHVEMYIGNNQLCGHGGPGYGPSIKQNARDYVKNEGYWQVRRYG